MDESDGEVFKWTDLMPSRFASAEETVEHILKRLNVYHLYSRAEILKIVEYMTHVQSEEGESADIFFVDWRPQSAGFEDYFEFKVINLIVNIIVLDERFTATG